MSLKEKLNKIVYSAYAAGYVRDDDFNKNEYVEEILEAVRNELFGSTKEKDLVEEIDAENLNRGWDYE